MRADAIECQSLQWQDRGYGADITEPWLFLELLSTLHIDQQEYLRLIDHFYDSDEPYFLARYDQESQDLENMIYIMKANHTKIRKRFPDLCDDTKRNFVATSEGRRLLSVQQLRDLRLFP